MTELQPNQAKSTAISNAISRIHRDHSGRGPTNARTVVAADHIVCFLEDTQTLLERTLIEGGEGESVVNARRAMQRVLEEQLVAAVEQLSGRRVRAFLSEVSLDPDLSVEIFLLHPTAESAERARAGIA